jgi:hypothetical protein
MADPMIWRWIITWPTGISFFFRLQVATGIPRQLGTTSYTDTNAPGASPLFYRVGVGN